MIRQGDLCLHKEKIRYILENEAVIVLATRLKKLIFSLIILTNHTQLDRFAHRIRCKFNKKLTNSIFYCRRDVICLFSDRNFQLTVSGG